MKFVVRVQRYNIGLIATGSLMNLRWDKLQEEKHMVDQ